MIAKDIYSDTIPALSIDDSAQRALYFMEFFKTFRLPIVEDGKYLGMLKEEDIIDIDKDAFLISDCKITLKDSFVYENQHIYEIVYLMSQYQMSLIAVVDTDNNYLGNINPFELLSANAKITSIDQTGSIIILKMGVRDYSLSEISQICESNQVKILSSYVQSCDDLLSIKLTLKLNTTDLTSLRLNFERYNYKIEAVFSENERVDDMNKDRLDEFLHYLNI